MDMSRKYKFHNPSAAYFVSFATVYWIDVFTRETYFKVLADSVSYCRKNKGMAPAGASLQTGDQQTIPIKIKPSYS